VAGEDQYRIKMALAGFDAKNIDLKQPTSRSCMAATWSQGAGPAVDRLDRHAISPRADMDMTDLDPFACRRKRSIRSPELARAN
jgi:hypothetical protein